MLKVDNTEIKLQKPIVDLVADIIRRKIVNGEIKHNLRLSTRQLSEELGISRTPVREAIRRLESEGLIELLPRKGFVVKEYSIDKIKEIYEVRRILEIKAIVLACNNIEKKELNNIEKIAQKLNTELQNEKSDILAIQELNQQLHFAIYLASHNETLCQIIKNLWHRVSGLLITIFSTPHRREEIPLEHEAIIKALIARDEYSCINALEKHMEVTKEILYEYSKKSRETKN
ncbi:hypothetical protein CVT91_02920 [Candidatus Atribacteria bacterium HGW-Atribacteria-1]|nr:MAG: hypothetical protein CVT91_02920 [Candidatus Atribacteria bacterium HGW-Atribacteria-1]